MKRIFTLLALVAFALPLLAQSPDLMTYQAVLRDAENHLITDQAVAVQISILQGAPNGTSVFTEVHSINTNENGLISFDIGDGVGDDLSTVVWSAGPYYIKTETDPAGGSNYTITSTTQLLSVPYAKYADEAGNVFSGTYGDLSGAPTNVSAFTNDAGYLTSGLWSLNGSNVYYNGGNVGIGTQTPDATLDVIGDTKYGSNGVAFNELREFTGTTTATYFVTVTLPTGYNETNTRVLSVEINYNGSGWVGLGLQIDGSPSPGFGVSYFLDDTVMYIYYPNQGEFHSQAFRALIMQIAP